MKSFIVLEEWFNDRWNFRMLTDGERIWIEFYSDWSNVWEEDRGFPSCSDEAFNTLVPEFCS